ncbi:hypothetical protein BGY98DRAFT_1023111 [Russula aff. rugulosa BPL654]|nr:hypothetical protein BGY98DRAFT_1023111 [Russula aff. rugulosa BPL654]
MYVYGGRTVGRTILGDLTTLNLSTMDLVSRHRSKSKRRYGHAMTCDGTRIFCSEVDDAKPIHILDTSMYFLFVISFGQPSSLKQSSSFTRNPTPTLSSIVRRPPNLRRSYPRVTRPRVNHNSRHSLPTTCPGEEDDSEGSTEHHAKLVAPDASEKEAARSEHERIADLERQLSETLAERAR